MPPHVAFLRAVNVGGRVVKMAEVARVFAGLGFADVTTFLASGNVVFSSPARDGAALAKRIETALAGTLGPGIDVFVRSDAEVAAIARHRPFPAPELSAGTAYNVALLAVPPGAAALGKLRAFETGIDRFQIHGREVHWLCAAKQSDSKFSNAVLEKALGQRSTIRGYRTLARLAVKHFGVDADTLAATHFL